MLSKFHLCAFDLSVVKDYCDSLVLQSFSKINRSGLECLCGIRGTHVVNQAFKALSDPTRREILRVLTLSELNAGEIADKFALGKPSISHHLAVLKDADLIR